MSHQMLGHGWGETSLHSVRQAETSIALVPGIAGDGMASHGRWQPIIRAIYTSPAWGQRAGPLPQSRSRQSLRDAKGRRLMYHQPSQAPHA